jgi:hypothetical protein
MGETEAIVLADFHAPKPRDVGLGMIVGGSIGSPIRLTMIAPVHRIAAVEQAVAGFGLVVRCRRTNNANSHRFRPRPAPTRVGAARRVSCGT